jgi:dolichyl-diphosphooligosaccharide--protein glycosyltransferase
MVAAWGGYVFVLNLIGVHAGLLFLAGRYSTKLYRAYTAFYAVGTLLAMQIPVVGWTPLKSLEQMGPLAVFLGFQLIEFVESVGRRRKLSSKKVWALRFQAFAIAGLFLLAVAAVLNQVGYFGPISSRIRGLFVKHTKTGNPLVDSVAEHQPASANAYEQYLGNLIVSLVPTGFVLVAVRYFHDSSSFLLVYALTTYFFSLKMVRLILLAAPIASILSGVTIGRAFGFLSYNIFGFPLSILHFLPEKKEVVSNKKSSKKKKKGTKDENGAKDEVTTNSPIDIGRSVVVKLISVYACYLFIGKYSSQGSEFITSSKGIAQHFANPTIVAKGNLQNGQEVIMDDYRDW